MHYNFVLKIKHVFISEPMRFSLSFTIAFMIWLSTGLGYNMHVAEVCNSQPKSGFELSLETKLISSFKCKG